ncbi:MAG: Rv2175c family DNA-binding protein [Nocardioidaceae bacterium]
MASDERGIPEPLAELVPYWLSLAEVAERFGVPASRVRQLAREHDLATAGRRAEWVPALFLDGPAVVKGLPGTLTLLHDAGYAPEEAIGWLFTSDESLPGRPIDALREDRGVEVRRRAQALGF